MMTLLHTLEYAGIILNWKYAGSHWQSIVYRSQCLKLSNLVIDGSISLGSPVSLQSHPSPPSTASIPPFQDLHDAFAFKDVFDPSFDHGPFGWPGLPDESAVFRTG